MSTINGANWIQKNQGFPNADISINSLFYAYNYLFAGPDFYSV